MKPEQIISKSAELKEQLLELTEFLVQEGGYFSPELQIVYDDTGLSLHTSGVGAEVKEHLSIPVELMPCISDYHFSIENGKIRCVPVQEKSRKRQRIMERMVRIYNLTDKIGFQAISSPFYALKGHPEFLGELIRIRTNDKLKRYLSLIQQNEFDTLLIESFLNSRAFNLKNKEGTFSSPVLMPIIDYCNHRYSAKGFKRDIKSERLSILPDGSGTKGQLYVRYNGMDYLEMFLMYGFVEEGAPFLVSVPVSVTLISGMRLSFNGTAIKVNKKLPVWMKSLEGMPVLIKQEKNEVTFSSITIPHHKNPEKLRQMLHFILAMIEPKQSESNRNEDVLRIEETILSVNTHYYGMLQERAGPINSDPQVSESVKEQLNRLFSGLIGHLRKYKAAIQQP